MLLTRRDGKASVFRDFQSKCLVRNTTKILEKMHTLEASGCKIKVDGVVANGSASTKIADCTDDNAGMRKVRPTSGVDDAKWSVPF